MAKRKVADIDDDLIIVNKRIKFDGYEDCCITCLKMTGTLDGLRALAGDDGYIHHNWKEHQQNQGCCMICSHIWEVFESDWDDVYDKYEPIRVYAGKVDAEFPLQKRNLNHPPRGSLLENLVFTLPETAGELILGLVVLEGA